MNTRLWILASVLLIAVMVVQGCTCPSKPAEPKPVACGPVGNVSAKMEFPTCSKVTVEKTAPRQVISGADFQYTIKVTNKTKTAVSDVALAETLPSGFRFKSATPTPVSGSTYRWNLGNMPAGSSQTIIITGTALKTGDLVTCTEVILKPEQLCMTLAAIEPRLEVAIVGPTDMVVCDSITYKITVKNAGTGQACNVSVKDVLPPGMKALDGNNTVVKNFGNLAPGQSRELTIDARVEKSGRYANSAKAMADGGLTASSSEVNTMFRTPILVVTKAGPGMEYVGKELTYSITVKNNGDAVSKNTVLTEQIHRGTHFQSATNSGKLESSYVIWQLGNIPPGESKTVSLTVVPSEKGAVTTLATAKAWCAESSASATTMVKGIPAILLECIDLEDPIKIGEKETYEIRVTNQGSENDTNIVVKCELPAELEFVSGDGPTVASADGRKISFAPLATLNPGATAVFKVVVKGVNAGDVRFMVNLTSDMMTTPAMETESTHVY